MDDKDKSTEKDQNETTSEHHGAGCILHLIKTVIGVPLAIMWVVWLIKGRPDTWYGTIVRLSYRIPLVILGIIMIIGVLVAIGMGISKLIETIKPKNEDTQTDEEDGKI